MREIKFKTWDGRKISWIEALIFPSKRRRANWIDTHIISIDVLENLMQFTGLKDKNGVDIYEGDILNLKGNEKCGMVLNVNEVVEFIEGCFCVMWGSFREPLYSVFAANEGEYEIIGNIYENPELLK